MSGESWGPEQYYLLAIFLALTSLLLIYATPGVPDEALTTIGTIVSLALGKRIEQGA